MNTEQLIRAMSDGRTSLNDIRNLLLQCGHSYEDWHNALGAILDDPTTDFFINSNFEVVLK